MNKIEYVKGFISTLVKSAALPSFTSMAQGATGAAHGAGLGHEALSSHSPMAQRVSDTAFAGQGATELGATSAKVIPYMKWVHPVAERMGPALSTVGLGAQSVRDAQDFGTALGKGQYENAYRTGVGMAGSAAGTAASIGGLVGSTVAPTLAKYSPWAQLTYNAVDAARSISPEYRAARLHETRPYAGHSMGNKAMNFLGNWSQNALNPVSGTINTVQQGAGLIGDLRQERSATQAADQNINRLRQSYAKATPEQRARVSPAAVQRYGLK